jgi:hypothetical protein
MHDLPTESGRRRVYARNRAHAARALACAAMAFALTMLFLRMTHPYRMARHPEWVLARCSAVAIGTFALTLVAARMRDGRSE